VQRWGSEFGPTTVDDAQHERRLEPHHDQAGVTRSRSPARLHKTPGATACLAREIHINGALVALNG
jgi:hypothetical protein